MQFPRLFVSLSTVCFLASVWIALPACAQLVQIPNLSGEAEDNNAFPFSSSLGAMSYYQQIYASSAFPHGGTIDKIMFRVDRGQFERSYDVELDLRVAFAYAATIVETASPIFASNIGDDFTVVLDGIVAQSHDGSIPRSAFGFVLDVADTFTYDPSRGDLLVQIFVRDPKFFTSFDAAWFHEQTVTTRIWASGTDEETGLVGLAGHLATPGPYGLVTQFQFIPEPSTIAQFWAILLLLIAHRRNKASKVTR